MEVTSNAARTYTDINIVVQSDTLDTLSSFLVGRGFSVRLPVDVVKVGGLVGGVGLRK